MSEYDGIKMNIGFDDELPLIDLKGRFSRIKHASIQTTTVNDESSGLLVAKPRQIGMCNTASEMSNEAWTEWANRNGIFIAHDPFDETGSTTIIKDGKIIKQY